jgi:hypothetical protein
VLAGVWYAEEGSQSTLPGRREVVLTTTPQARAFGTLTLTGNAASPYINVEFEPLSQPPAHKREDQRVTSKPANLEADFDREFKRMKVDESVYSGERRLYLCAMASTYLVVGLSLSETRWLSP